jgi:subtilisin family serine protease
MHRKIKSWVFIWIFICELIVLPSGYALSSKIFGNDKFQNGYSEIIEENNKVPDIYIDPQYQELANNEKNLNLFVNVILVATETHFNDLEGWCSEIEDIKILNSYPDFAMLAVVGTIEAINLLQTHAFLNAIYLDDEIQTMNSIQSTVSLDTDDFHQDNAIRDPFIDELTGLEDLKQNLDTDMEKIKGNGTVIAVLDSGVDFAKVLQNDTYGLMEQAIDYMNYNFVGMNTFNSSVNFNLLAGVSFIPYEPLYYSDLNGDGTFHAGIAAAYSENASEYEGIAPEASLLNVKVVDSLGLTYYSFVLSGLRWALSNDADIVLIPWTFPGYYDDPICLAINDLADHGIVVITASGDDGPAYTSTFTPGQALKSITVGAYDQVHDQVAEFSSRGPSYDMRVGVDIVAPGINITGPTTSLQNASFIQQSSSGAAAALVTGLVAILISHFPTATPEMIKIALLKTAHPLSISSDVNEEGFGLINISATFNFLQQYLPTHYSIQDRPTPSQALYPGTIINVDAYNETNNPLHAENWDPYDIFALTGTQGMITALGVINGSEYSESTQYDIHIPMNQFGIAYNQTYLTFSELEVYREMDMIVQPYDPSFYTRYSGVLGVSGGLFIAIIIESWAYTYESWLFEYPDFDQEILPPFAAGLTGRIPSFQISLSFINTGSAVYHNLTLYSLFKSDLYMNEMGIDSIEAINEMNNILEMNASTDDTFVYNSTNQLIYSYDQYTTGENATNEFTMMGFNSTTHQLNSWEINATEDLFGNLLEGEPPSFSNQNLFDPMANESKDLGFGQSWLLSPMLKANQICDFSSILSIGKGNSSETAYESMMRGFERLIHNVTVPEIEDLAILYSQTPRMGRIDTSYQSAVAVINLGTVEMTGVELYFSANFTSTADASDIYSKVFYINQISPKVIKNFQAEWIPDKEGVYFVGWGIGGLNQEWGLLDDLPTNNFQQRLVVIYDYSSFSQYISDLLLISPAQFPVAPFSVQYPGDMGMVNFTILSPIPLGECQIEITGMSANILDFESLQWYSNTTYKVLALNIFVPLFFKKGMYLYNVHLFTNYRASHQVIPIQFQLRENLGRILFDGIHNEFIPSMDSINFDFGYDFSLTSLFDERLDTLYGNYNDFQSLLTGTQPKGYAMMQLIAGLDLMELVGGQFDTDSFSLSDSNMSDSLAMERLFKGDNFYSDIGNLTTDYFTYDLVKFFDAIVIPDPEIAFTPDEILNLSRYLNLGGVIFVFAENASENDVDSINRLLALGGMEFENQSFGSIQLASSEAWDISIRSQVNSIILQDPLKIVPTETNSSMIALNDYIAYSPVGLGKIVAIGDDDILSQAQINKADNARFIQTLFDFLLNVKFEFSTSVNHQEVSFGEKTYLEITLENRELELYLQEDFLAIAGFVDSQGTVLNASLFGFEIPILPMIHTNSSALVMEIDSSWGSPGDEIWVTLIIDSPYALSETFCFQIKILEAKNEEAFVQFEQPDPPYPLLLEVVFIFLLLLSIVIVWLYSAKKWRLRHRYVPLSDENRAKIHTYLSGFMNFVHQLESGIKSNELDELEKIRFILQNEERLVDQISEIQDLSSELGEK